jgi:hypothetical protein
MTDRALTIDARELPDHAVQVGRVSAGRSLILSPAGAAHLAAGQSESVPIRALVRWVPGARRRPVLLRGWHGSRGERIQGACLHQTAGIVPSPPRDQVLICELHPRKAV